MVSITLITPRRSLIILLTILFSSAIFSTSSSIIFSINNFNEYLYGNQPNVLIIYDKQAQTPFTSRVPASYDNILQQIKGVEVTSPELVIPGILEQDSVLMRGVNVTGFSQISNIQIVKGDGLDPADKASAIIGQSLADRLGITVGSQVTFEGSLRNNGIFLKINGIFSGSSELEDEILTTLGTASKVARRTGEYNHIKVKFDPEVTTQQEIIDLVTSSFNVDISLMTNNQTELYNQYNLQVYDTENDLLVNTLVNGTYNVNLPFGEYRFIFSDNNEVITDQNRFIQADTDLTFSSGDDHYQVNLDLQSDYNGQLMYSLYNGSEYRIADGMFQSNYTLDTVLIKGNYQLELAAGGEIKRFDFQVDHQGRYAFDFTPQSLPQITELNKSTSLTTGTTIFHLSNVINTLNYSVMIGTNTYGVDDNLTSTVNLLAGSNQMIRLFEENRVVNSYQVNITSAQVNSVQSLIPDTIDTSSELSQQNMTSYNLLIHDRNFNFTQPYAGFLDYNNSGILQRIYYSGSIGSNFIQQNLILDGFSGSTINADSIMLQKNILRRDIYLMIGNDLGVEADNIIINHRYLADSQSPIDADGVWQLINFPIGPIQIQVTRLRSTFTANFTVSATDTDVKMILKPIADVSIDKFLAANTQISADVASEFFNQELTGPFAFFRIALLAETIIIIFLLLINVSGVYAGVVSEHRYELRTLKSIGFSNNELILSIIRGSLYLSIPTLLLGGLLGLGLSNILLLTNNTVLFGHRFIPRFPISYWIMNFIVGHILIYFGAFVGLKLEEDTIIS